MTKTKCWIIHFTAIVPAILNKLLDKLYEAVVKGDLEATAEILRATPSQIEELLPKITSAKSRAIISKVIVDINELVERLSVNKANLDDVRAFVYNAREKLTQRLAEKNKNN